MKAQPEIAKKKVSLPVMGAKQATGQATMSEAELEAELARFEAEERRRLGLFEEREQWKDEMIESQFAKSERPNVTLLVCGLTMAHDFLIEGGLKGLGYNVQRLEVPSNAALQYGKEFGNRGQCNPTYFTVGNLVKHLCELRDVHGMSSEEIIKRFIFVTAGACGPCRFGMYVTEYRKALRDAGFDGFRVMLFQQTGGFDQATGDEAGLEMNQEFFITLTKAALCGDVINALAYRIRPYEQVEGETDEVIEEAKRLLYEAFATKRSILFALTKVRKLFQKVEIDPLRVRPKVAIIGEFWAMTTEGDGNYQLQRFLEGEGAEPDIQLVTAWLLYMLWEGRNDTKERLDLRGADTSLYGLGDLGVTGAAQRLAILRVADAGARAVFQVFANLAGLHNYHLPDMDLIADVAHEFYNKDLRGGEGHMEVGKLILNTLKNKAHLTLSVKPFGCMPSASVSDGVQSVITERFPGSLYCAVETSGDGAVNFYSRIQMFLHKARAKAEKEYQQALADNGVTQAELEAFLKEHPSYASSLYHAPHTSAGAASDIVNQIAPLVGKSRFGRARVHGSRAVEKARKALPQLVSSAKSLADNAPETAARLKEDATVVGELLKGRIEQWVPLAKRLTWVAMQPDGGGEMVSNPSRVQQPMAAE